MDEQGEMEVGWLSLTGWLVIACITLVTIWAWRRCRVYSTFSKVGIPGPKPVPFLGNLISMMRLGFHEFFEKNAGYGKVYGMYFLFQPSLCINDLEMAREILMKKFQSFPNRQLGDFQPPFRDMLTTLTDDHWKHVRSTLSPTFSTGKIKRMVPAIQHVLGTMKQYLKSTADKGDPLETKEFFGRCSMDFIGGAAFGLQVDSIHNTEEPFAKHASTIMNANFLTQILRAYALGLYNLLYTVFGMNAAFENAIKFFMTVTDKAIKERQESKEKAQDFLQLLIEAENDGDNHGPVDAEIDHGEQLSTSSQWKRKGLTKDEMMANALLFLLAGFDNLSTTISFTLFYLAHHPDCLKKVQEEVDEKLGKSMVNYEMAQELTYTDMCVNETMRLHSAAVVMNRQAKEDVEVCGLNIEKGMTINILASLIHTDPEIWPEPKKFDPLRHTAEAKATRHPMAFMPFGLGPRNCIAMRLAQLEVRMVLATVLQHFTPVPCDKSVFPPRLDKFKMMAVDGLWLKFQHRGNE